MNGESIVYVSIVRGFSKNVISTDSNIDLSAYSKSQTFLKSSIILFFGLIILKGQQYQIKKCKI